MFRKEAIGVQKPAFLFPVLSHLLIVMKLDMRPSVQLTKQQQQQLVINVKANFRHEYSEKSHFASDTFSHSMRVYSLSVRLLQAPVHFKQSFVNVNEQQLAHINNS